MALIDKETIRAEIERRIDNYRNQEYGKEQIVNLPKWQKLKNIDSYSDRKIWNDDKVLFVVDGEGYLYMCSIRELFDKLPKEE